MRRQLFQRIAVLLLLLPFAPMVLEAAPGHYLRTAAAMVAPEISVERLGAVEHAAAAAQSSGDNAWMLTSSALVLLMTGPGLALFYGGLVRRKTSSAQ